MKKQKKIKEIYDLSNFKKYKKEIKKNINKCIMQKDKDKKLNVLKNIFKIFIENFLELSDEITEYTFLEKGMPDPLFLLIAEEVNSLNDKILDFDKLDELSIKDDYEIDKIRSLKLRRKKLDNSKLLNSYFDIKDDLDFYLNELDKIFTIRNNDKIRNFATKEYFTMGFSIYCMFDDITKKMQEKLENYELKNLESFMILEFYLRKIKEEIDELKEKKTYSLRFFKASI